MPTGSPTPTPAVSAPPLHSVCDATELKHTDPEWVGSLRQALRGPSEAAPSWLVGKRAVAFWVGLRSARTLVGHRECKCRVSKHRWVLQEGKAASLAADFSIQRFEHLGRLLVVHGRSSYKRSAALGQFVMHRGLVISTMQVPQGQAGHGTGGRHPPGHWPEAWTDRCHCPLSQAVFSSIFYFASVPLYQGFLMVG